MRRQCEARHRMDFRPANSHRAGGSTRPRNTRSAAGARRAAGECRSSGRLVCHFLLWFVFLCILASSSPPEPCVVHNHSLVTTPTRRTRTTRPASMTSTRRRESGSSRRRAVRLRVEAASSTSEWPGRRDCKSARPQLRAAISRLRWWATQELMATLCPTTTTLLVYIVYTLSIAAVVSIK